MPVNRVAQVVGRMLHTLCTLRWPSNFVKHSSEVARVMKVVFNLKENLWPLNFISEGNLKAFKLASVEGP